MSFALRFPLSAIPSLGSRYSYKNEELVERIVGPRAREQGFLTLDDFLTLCRWKAPRAERHYVQNLDSDIRAVTKLALSTTNDRLKISLLMALHGVNWPMASVILHFTAQEPYPILDFRALWSLSVMKPNFYTFGLWRAYTGFCRVLAAEANVPMRTLDRALWQYSKENQGAARYAACLKERDE